MIDWLQRGGADPELEIAGQMLPVAIRRHARARRMTLRLAPDGSEVRVTIPNWGRTQDALAFARSREDWLAGQLTRLPECVAVGPGSELRYCGEMIRVDWSPDHPRKPELSDARLRLGGPEGRVAARVQRWLEARALDLMAADLGEYCALAEVPEPKIALSRAKRRWGSCSTSGTVRINWRLVQAPDFVRRSVVAHEVAHLVHFDHSPQFHALLARIFGERLDAADRWLKTEGRTLYAAFP